MFTFEEGIISAGCPIAIILEVIPQIFIKDVYGNTVEKIFISDKYSPYSSFFFSFNIKVHKVHSFKDYQHQR